MPTARSNGESPDLGLLQGTLDVMILKALSWGPMHGFAVAKWVRSTTDDVLQIDDGALYPALHRMEHCGLIDADWDLTENKRRAKYYRLTAKGRQELRARCHELGSIRERGLQGHPRYRSTVGNLAMAGHDTRKWHRYLTFLRPNIAADVDTELAFHVDARTEELCAAGVERSAARAQALREFGDVDLARRTLRSMDERHAASERRAHFAGDILGDVRVAIRALRRSPGLVAVVALTFALGIGVTGAMYSVVDNLLFKPLPGRDGAGLIVLGRTEERLPQPHELSYPDFRDYRADTTVFASLVGYTSRVVELKTDRGADRIRIDDATANYFEVLGLRPMLGRTFDPDEDRGTLAHPIIVLTYKGWQAHFAGDSGVIGRAITINGHPVTVIGVTGPEFHGVRPLVDMDGVVPMDQVWPAYGAELENRASTLVSVFGRLRPGVSLSAARVAVRLKARQLERAYPVSNRNVGTVLVREQFTRPSHQTRRPHAQASPRCS